MVRLSPATSLTTSASPRARQVADDALAERDRVGHDGRSAKEPLATNGRKTRPSSSARKTALVSAVSRVSARSAMRSRTDAEVEHGRDLRRHLGQGRHLAGLALRVAVEPGVLDGDADVGGERRQEPLVGLAEAAALGRVWTLTTPMASSPAMIGHAEVGAAPASRRGPTCLELRPRG